MASYILHLGFNWNSPLIGEIWGSKDSSYRFLQYALEGAGVPAWFLFNSGDTLTVRIWDLTSPPQEASPSLQLSFAPLDAGNPTLTYDPSTLVSCATAKTSSTAQGSYLEFTATDGFVTQTPEQGPWSSSTMTYLAGPLTFTKDATYKLSFRLKMTLAGGLSSEIFISDPEVIVGSRGG